MTEESITFRYRFLYGLLLKLDYNRPCSVNR